MKIEFKNKVKLMEFLRRGPMIALDLSQNLALAASIYPYSDAIVEPYSEKDSPTYIEAVTIKILVDSDHRSIGEEWNVFQQKKELLKSDVETGFVKVGLASR